MSRIRAAGRRSNTSVMAPWIFVGSTVSVPKVSTNSPTGAALPMAYATWTSVRWASPAATTVLATQRIAYLGEPPGETVGQRDRERHQLRRVGAGVAEHQALVTRALLGDEVLEVRHGLDARLVGGVHTLGDVDGLRADRDVHTAGVAVEALLRGVVPHLQDAIADQRG